MFRPDYYKIKISCKSDDSSASDRRMTISADYII